MRPINKVLGSAIIFVIVVILSGVILEQWGIVANGAVIVANDGKMPVVPQRNMTLDDNPGFARKLSDGSENLLFLSDIFLVRFPEIETAIRRSPVAKPIAWWVEKLYFPWEGGLNSISIGDIMRWLGSAAFLLFLPLLVILIPIMILCGFRPRKNPLHWIKKAPE